jgi:2',3'-cyclic-nucleotide 2'-phosphodiesterase/3'-nucleotidase
MNRRSFLFALGFGAFTALAGLPLRAEGTVQLRLLGTSDLHVNVLPYNYYTDQEDVSVGLARTAALITAARAEVRNALLFDNGDTIQGNPLGDFIARERGLKPGDVHPVYRALNLLKYDAGTVGNHEFNYGLEFLDNALAGLRSPVVVANVLKADGDADPSNNPPFLEPYEILPTTVIDEDGESRTLKVGVIGFVTPQITTWDKAHLDGRITTIDIVEAARRFVPELRAKGADVVVALAHTGISAVPRQGGEENAAWYLSQAPGIDAIVSGHAHKVFPGPDFAGLPAADLDKGTLHGVPVVMPGFWGSHLGVIDLTLKQEGEAWRVVDGRAASRPIYETRERRKVALVQSDPEVVEAVKADHEATLAYVRQPVGETTAPINSYFALVQDDPSIQIVTNAQKWYVERLVGSPSATPPTCISTPTPCGRCG